MFNLLSSKGKQCYKWLKVGQQIVLIPMHPHVKTELSLILFTPLTIIGKHIDESDRHPNNICLAQKRRGNKCNLFKISTPENFEIRSNLYL